MFNKKREVTFEGIAKFVETRARALNHPIFGNLNSDVKSKGKDNSNRSLNAGTFGTCGEERKNADDNNKKASSDEFDQERTQESQLSRQALHIPSPENSFPKRVYQEKSKCRKRHEMLRRTVPMAT